MTNTAHILSTFLLTIIISNYTYAGPSLKEGPVSLKIAIFDTGFCIDQLPKNEKILIHPIYFADKEFTLPCQDLNSHPARFHGQKVLSTFINHYSGKKTLEIYPVIVFDQEGAHKVSYWKSAMPKIMREKVTHVLSATGVPLLSKIQAILPKTIHFTLASGRKEASLKQMVSLFPQDYLPKKQRTIVGSQLKLSESVLQDPLTYRPGEVDVWIDEHPDEPFKGSSRAVAVYFAKKLSE